MSVGNESQCKIICTVKGGEILGRNSIDSNLYTCRTWHNEKTRGRKCLLIVSNKYCQEGHPNQTREEKSNTLLLREEDLLLLTCYFPPSTAQKTCWQPVSIVFNTTSRNRSPGLVRKISCSHSSLGTSQEGPDCPVNIPTVRRALRYSSPCIMQKHWTRDKKKETTKKNPQHSD